MIKKWPFLFFILFFGTIHAEEYLYPVAAFTASDGQPRLYLIYQKSVQHLELWLWNPATKHASKALLSTFTPAGLSMLLDNSGFSFIDEGRIRVKKFMKRSPKTLDIYEPLYTLGPVAWADAGTAYFHAKERNNFGIFLITLQSELQRLVVGDGVDCMYPCKIDSELFYIERSLHMHPAQEPFHLQPMPTEQYAYAIKQIPYCANTYDPCNAFNNASLVQERVDALLHDKPVQRRSLQTSSNQASVILSFGKRPISFLKMISNRQGFFIEHPPVIDKHDQEIIFLCHALECGQEGSWKSSYLFSFSLPTRLLVPGSACLHESMLPLLPRYDAGTIYFADCSRVGSTLSLFGFDLSSGKIKQVIAPAASYSFSPVRSEAKFYYGGALTADPLTCGQPSMSMSDDGQISVELPFFVPCIY